MTSISIVTQPNFSRNIKVVFITATLTFYQSSFIDIRNLFMLLKEMKI